MIIAVDGLDGAGKTTLCQRLAIASGQPNALRHHSKPTKHPIDEYDIDRIPLVMDRGFLGEMVWPEIWGRKSELTRPVFAYLCAQMQGAGGTYVYLDVPVEIARQRTAERGGDDLLDEKDRWPAKQLFDTWFKMLSCPKIRLIDNVGEDVEQLADRMQEKALTSVAARAFWLDYAVGDLIAPTIVYGIEGGIKPYPQNKSAVKFWTMVYEDQLTNFAAVTARKNLVAEKLDCKFQQWN